MSQNAKRGCPICTNTVVEVLHTQHFVLPEGHPLSKGYDVVCCNECGFVYADVSVSQSAYDFFYTKYSKYEDQKTGTGGGETSWDRRRLDATAAEIAQRLGNQRLRVLDMGCANGGLLRALKERGYSNLVGIDPSPGCVENTRRLGFDAVQGSFSKEYEKNSTEIIILSHILEHVQDLRQAARWVAEVLENDPRSRIYIEVPDASRYQDYVYAPFQDFNTEHINHFSPTTLANFLAINGFSPLEKGEKLLEISSNCFYPAIYCFAQYNGKKVSPRMMPKDIGLKTKMLNYIKISRSEMDAIENTLQHALSSAPRVVVWGTGQLSMKLLSETCLSNADIVAFVDSNPINQGKTLRGMKVISPSEVPKFSHPILVATILQQQSVVEQIRSLHLPNQIILLKAVKSKEY